MKGILFRSLCNVMGFVLTLPLRLVILIASICYMAYIAIMHELSFRANLILERNYLSELEIVKKFDELMTYLKPEEES